MAKGHKRRALRKTVGAVGNTLGSAAETLNDVGQAIGSETAQVLGRRRRLSIHDPLLWGRERRHEPGTAPGTLAPDPQAIPTTISLIGYGPDELDEHSGVTLDEVRACLDSHAVTWVNVEGLADVDTLAALGTIFGIHPLVLEDVVSVHQRSKVEQYGENVFFVTRMVTYRGEELHAEQVSIFFGNGFLVTFQEGIVGDCFEHVRRRLRAGVDRLRVAGVDYLAYALIDAIVDSMFPVLEAYGEQLELLESHLLERPTAQSMAHIHEAKRDLLALRRIVWPLREAVNSLVRDEHPVITTETRTYLRDAYDHTVQIIDLLETYRELASGLVDLYLSSVSNRMNEVMKVLTIIATIFIPLSFIAGVYGMNFDTRRSPWNMPELEWYLGYPFALGLMLVVAGVLVTHFWRRGWLSRGDD